MATYDFNVIVKDQSGNLVESATVSVYTSAGDLVGSADTNSSGILASNITLDTASNTHRVQVTKTGYTTYNAYYEIAYNDTSYYIRLPSYSTTYATVSKVSEFMGLGSNCFTPTSTPTDSVVSDMILRNEQEIDTFLMTSFKSNTVTQEFANLNRNSMNSENFVPIWVRKRPLITKDSDWKLEVWEGSDYTDFVASKTEGRASDYYIDYDKNIIYIKPTGWGDSALRLTYKWGRSSVPYDIEKLCILKTALNLVDLDDLANNIRTSDNNTLSTKRDSYIQQIKILEKHLTKFRF